MNVDLFAIQKHTNKNQPMLLLESSFETLVIGTKGGMIGVSGEFEINLNAPFLYLNSRNEPLTLSHFTETTEFYTLSFSADIIPNFYFEIAHSQKDSNFVSFDPSSCFLNVVSLSEMIYFETTNKNSNPAIVYNLIRSIFSIFLSEQNKKASKNKAENQQNLHLSNFIVLLENNFKTNKTIEFYSNQLVISPRQLNKITQDILGVTTSQIINSRKIVEAKKLLAQTDQNVSEIGYSIGFKEKSHFSTIFKKATGVTPLAYRKQFKQVI